MTRLAWTPFGSAPNLKERFVFKNTEHKLTRLGRGDQALKGRHIVHFEQEARVIAESTAYLHTHCMTGSDSRKQVDALRTHSPESRNLDLLRAVRLHESSGASRLIKQATGFRFRQQGDSR